MKLKATILAAIMAVSVGSHAQERTAVGFRLGSQYIPDFCSRTLSCKGAVPVVNPYVRLHIEGPHNLEMAGKFALADYKRHGIIFRRNLDDTLTPIGEYRDQMDSKSLSLSYEHRPLGGDMAFRVGWHYTEIGQEDSYFYYDSRERLVEVSDEDKVNGFLVGVGFDLFRGINMAVDWAGWEGTEAYSMMIGYEI